MPPGDPKYTSEQRDAIASAWNDRRIRPARRVCELAKAGELTRPDGSKLPAFTVPEGTVRSLARHARKRRRGELGSAVAEMPPRDAIEALRVRLVSVADHELKRIEDLQRTRPREKLDAEQLRQVARAVLEAARLPGPNDPRPAAQGVKDTAGKQGPVTTGGLAGSLLKAHRSNGDQALAAQDKAQHATHDGESSGTHDDASVQTDETSNEPGAWASEQMGALAER